MKLTSHCNEALSSYIRVKRSLTSMAVGVEQLAL